MKFLTVILILFSFQYTYADAVICDGSSNATVCANQNDCYLSAADLQRKMNRDLDQCQSTKSAAQDCCGSGSNCGGGSAFGGSGGSGGGSDMQNLMKIMLTVSAATLIAQSSPGQMQDMSQLCNMFTGMNTAGGNMNGNNANGCSLAKDDCNSACAGRDDYYNNLALCLTDSAAKQYLNDNRAPFATSTRTCNRLSATTMRQQANNQNNAGMAQACNNLNQQQQQMAQMTPVSLPTAPDCTNPTMIGTQICQSCADPTSPACQKAITDSAAANSGFQPASAQNMAAGGFNVGSPGKIGQSAQFAQNNPQDAPKPSGMTPPLGGPSGPFGGQQNAQAAANGPQRPGYGPGYNTDVLRGDRSGSPINTAGGTLEYDATNAYSADPNRGLAGLDLRNYLPGRHLYGGRKVAGVGSMNPDINSQTTDIFKRISDRFRVICSLNRLVDCSPAPIANKTGGI